MSNSIFQSVILQLKEFCDRPLGVLDTDGYVISCTDPAMLGERWTDAVLRISGNLDQTVSFGQKTFRAITSSVHFFEYAVFCAGDDEQARIYCNMAYVALNNARSFYEEKHDRGTFV